jgi:hypothetical protein
VDSVFSGIRVFSNWLAGITLPANELRLMHDGGPPALREEYVRVLGDMPVFGAEANVASFNAAMLTWPVPNADVSLYPVLQQHAEQLLQQRAPPKPRLRSRCMPPSWRGCRTGRYVSPQSPMN